METEQVIRERTDKETRKETRKEGGQIEGFPVNDGRVGLKRSFRAGHFVLQLLRER